MTSRFIENNASAVNNSASSSRPQDSLYSNMDLPLRRLFYPLGFPVEILTNSPEVLEAAQDSFGHRTLRWQRTALQVHVGVKESDGVHCPPEPTRRQYNHLYSMVADAENQALLDLKSCASFIWLNRSALQSRIYLRHNFLEKVVYLMLGSSVVTDIHAACVSKNGKGILLCGESGAGKSTLAYACARAGWTYTSDDTSYLLNQSVNQPMAPRVIGHAHRVRFRPAAKTLFPELEGREITPRMEGKASIEVPVSELPPINTATEVTVHSIVYLNRGSVDEATMVPLPEHAAAKRMCAELYSAGEIRNKHEKILQSLATMPAYELQYCNLEQAIEQLEVLVGDL